MKFSQIPTPFPLITTQQLHLGDRIVLVGDNGIGKSVMMTALKRWVYQQHLPLWSFVDQGRIQGFDLATVKSYLELMVKISPTSFQNTDFYSWLGFKEGQVDKYLNHPLEYLSGGEMQWLKIIIGLNLKTQYFIWDEPTQFLDINRKNKLWELLKTRLQPDDVMLMILHQELPPFAHKIWKMKMGELPHQRTINQEELN